MGGLKELRLGQLSVSEEEMVGDAFWRACATTELLRLKQSTRSFPKTLAKPQEAVLDLDADVLSRASISDNPGDGDGNKRSAMNSTGAGTGGSGEGGGGRRPYSFSRVKHLEVLGPFTMELDELSLIRYCHNIKSLHWDAIAPTFASDVAVHRHIPTTPSHLLPVPQGARRDYYTWKNLESLHLDGDGAIDANLTIIIQWCFQLTSLIIPGTRFGNAAMAELRHHFRTLHVLNWMGCTFALGPQTQTIMASCPNLETFKTNEFMVDYRVDEAWVCTGLSDFTAQRVVFHTMVDGDREEVVKEVKRKAEARIYQLVNVKQSVKDAFIRQF
ncbi:hypothetical protein BGZ96_005134 [Linnemannia gamsii]|uniref:F-box protein n=1 Tax=Linnemannia gamsii TaxID=64522 RepID=A0ABQ7K715_9FUNG|nr:hypothetical protein BGZ96_005134 [Linnemannia gamsii]